MAGFFARRKYRKEVKGRLHAMLLLYPGGVSNLDRNYPNLGKAIDGNFDAGDVHPGHSAVMVAGSILANELEALNAAERKAIRDQLAQIDIDAFKEALRTGQELPRGMLAGTSLVSLAFIVANVALKGSEITENQFKSFTSEVFGALDGKDSDQRFRKSLRDILDDTLGPPTLKDGDDDLSDTYSSTGWNGEFNDLNGMECKVRIAKTAVGYALIRLEDGEEILERRALTQHDIEKVKPEDWNECRFVNLRTRGGEIVSCLIVGRDSETIGSRRAFWWALAKVSVQMTDVRVGSRRMSQQALARVHKAARGMWDAVLERAHSIEELRDEPMYARNLHLEVMSRLIEEQDNEADKLGLEICKAMTLAVQSEDDKLEAAAYRRFKRYLWRRGEEPLEFYAHDDRESAE